MTWTFGRWQRKIWEMFPRALVRSNWQSGGPTWGEAILDQSVIDTWHKDEQRGPEWYNGLDRLPISKPLSSQPQKGE